MAHGLYGGDEALHGNNPTQGSELCSAVEMMFSLEKIPSWGLYYGMAGPIPYSMTNGLETGKETEEITLIPYGCTTLRISQFPDIYK